MRIVEHPKALAPSIAMEMLQSFNSLSGDRAEMPRSCKSARKFYDHVCSDGRSAVQENQYLTKVTITIAERVLSGQSLVYTVSVASVVCARKGNLEASKSRLMDAISTSQLLPGLAMNPFGKNALEISGSWTTRICHKFFWI